MVETAAPSKNVVRLALVQASRGASSDTASRLLDLVVAIIALLLFGPLMILVSVGIALQRDGPILFRQTRVGQGGVAFDIMKFRTMTVDGDRVLADHLLRNPAAAEEWDRDRKLRSDPRVSFLGNILRRSSLDELPQLLNVLKGEMSIVGPRPIVSAEVVRYGQAFAYYCNVRPGITGVWQVSGRNDISYKRRVAMDALYSRRKNVLLDIRLMVATVPAVLLRRGSY